MDMRQLNWARNYEFSASQLHSPKTVEEVQKVVKSCRTLKALGTGHSFNGIADSAYDQVSLRQLDEMVLDCNSRTVSVGAGVTYGRLASYLDGHGYALHNLASLPHISVVGACATATHGSGSQERQPGNGGFRDGNGRGGWRVSHIVQRARRPAVPWSCREFGRPGNRDQGHAGGAAKFPSEAGGLRKPIDGSFGKPPR